MFGLTIVRHSRLDAMLRQAAVNAQVGDAAKIQHIIATDEGTRARIAKVARSAAKDHLEQAQEDARAAFEGTQEFQQWAQERRERDLAAASAPPPQDSPTSALVNDMLLRYGLLGMMIEHGTQTLPTMIEEFAGAGAARVEIALGMLISEGLVELSHGHYGAVDFTPRVKALGIKEAGGNADPDPQ